LGVRKVVIASKEATYGVRLAEGDKDFCAFPLAEEDYDVDPMDSYGLSKLCVEKTARAFAGRYGADIYALPIGDVIEPHEYGQFRRFLADPPSRKRCAWSCIDARDLGEIALLCLEKDGLGIQVFNATNNTIALDALTKEALKTLAPRTPITRAMGASEAPLLNRRTREAPGFREKYNWRQCVSEADGGARRRRRPQADDARRRARQEENPEEAAEQGERRISRRGVI